MRKRVSAAACTKAEYRQHHQGLRGSLGKRQAPRLQQFAHPLGAEAHGQLGEIAGRRALLARDLEVLHEAVDRQRRGGRQPAVMFGRDQSPQQPVQRLLLAALQRVAARGDGIGRRGVDRHLAHREQVQALRRGRRQAGKKNQRESCAQDSDNWRLKHCKPIQIA
jgi:hypothetical protein